MKIVDGGVNDIRIVGAVALAVMIIICAVGMEWETKAQNFLIAIIVAAIFNFVIGSIMGPQSEAEKAQGFVGFSSKYLKPMFSSYESNLKINISCSRTVYLELGTGLSIQRESRSNIFQCICYFLSKWSVFMCICSTRGIKFCSDHDLSVAVYIYSSRFTEREHPPVISLTH